MDIHKQALAWSERTVDNQVSVNGLLDRKIAAQVGGKMHIQEGIPQPQLA